MTVDLTVTVGIARAASSIPCSMPVAALDAPAAVCTSREWVQGQRAPSGAGNFGVTCRLGRFGAANRV